MLTGFVAGPVSRLMQTRFETTSPDMRLDLLVDELMLRASQAMNGG